MSSRDRIKVVCRIRPENKIELAGAYKRCVEYDNENISVECTPESKVSDMVGKHDFTFDAIFGPDSRQVDVFNQVAAPVVTGVLDGYNGTIFAYGQTGSGKSFSMEGVRGDAELAGIIPRMFDFLFKSIGEADPDVEFTIKCSYLEIYMERIMDLLDAKKVNLQVKEDKTRGLYVADSTEVYVSSTDEMMAVMNAGSQNRSVAATRMNAVSSRSHSIFLVTVQQKNTKTDTTKLGKLFCCDLAGSEKTEKTEATGQTLEEAKMINKSLSALGNVINALTEQKGKGSFIPYRDSKLTRILQESLGGNSQTCLLITCSLSCYNDRETLSTLRFGNRAKSIKNALKQNAQRSAKELIGLLNIAEAKIVKNNEIIQMIQAKVKNAKSLEELEQISASKDTEILYQLLKGGAQIPIEQETVAEIQSSNNNNNNSVQTAQIAKLQNQISELQKQNQDLEDEKKHFEEEIEQNNKQLYQQNEKLIFQEFAKEQSSLKQDNLAIETLYQLKDSNIKKRADIIKMRSRLQNLKSDIQIHSMSAKLKMQDLAAKMHSTEQILDTSNNQEKSVDSEQMVNEQIQGTIDLLNRMENALNEDIQSITFSKKDQITSTSKFLKGRRRSTGNITAAQLALIFKNEMNTSVNESQNNPNQTYAQQLNNQPILSKKEIDQTMMTEVEYLKFLHQDNSIIMQDNETSFFKGILNVEKTGLENQNRIDENLALKEINEQQLKKIQDLQIKVEELEEENKHLGKEHLAMLKKQDETKTEQSTLAESTDDQVLAIKDKQIDLLSSMLAQKEVDLKNQQISHSSLLKEENAKFEKIIAELKIQHQSQIKRLEQMSAIIEKNDDMKTVLNANLMTEQNKILKTQVGSMHRQLDQKDSEIESLQTKVAQLEKKMVLMQKDSQQAQLMQKINKEAGVSQDQIQNLIMPFATAGGQIQFGNKNDVSFFNNKVFKPIRGGGGGNNQSNELDFKSFQQSMQSMNTNSRQRDKSRANNFSSRKDQKKALLQDLSLTRSNDVSVRGQGSARNNSGFGGFMTSFKSQEQMVKHKQKEEAAMAKAKKLLAQQKYNEARQMTAKQMMQDESTLNDDYTIPDTKRDGDMNDTYANFDSEPDEDENSDEEQNQQRTASTPQKIETEQQKKKKNLASKLFNGASKLKNKFM